jgi:hypothetical protein
MAATPKPVRKAQKSYAKKSAEHHKTSLKEGMKKAKASGVGHKYNEMGHKVSGKTKKAPKHPPKAFY